jgi:glycosyltransferase involved in cell wall biosynthesis
VVFLEFQNQSVMPVVYRLGDALVLPSGYGETWGLAVNEAQACGRPSLVSDCVGCARDIIREGENGMIFRTDEWDDCVVKMRRMAVAWSKETEKLQDQKMKSLRGEKATRPKQEETSGASRRKEIRARAWEFDTTTGVKALLAALGILGATGESEEGEVNEA